MIKIINKNRQTYYKLPYTNKDDKQSNTEIGGKTSFKKYREIYRICGASLMAQSKESACNEGDLGSIPGLER